MTDSTSKTDRLITLHRLAAGSYDIDQGARTIGCLVKDRHEWIAELLAGSGAETPPPFTDSEHRFQTLEDALIWLGRPAMKTR